MAAHAGERALETGTCSGGNWHRGVRIQKGDRIPRCPNCGTGTFGERRHEPD